jgi:hypothetical protein
MTRPVAFWVSVFAALGVVDLWLDTKHNGSTLSEVTRAIFRTERPLGRAAFTLALAAGGAWFWDHIVSAQRGTLDEAK